MDEAINKSADVTTGEIVECTVEQIVPYGAFVRITKTGKKGMIHISEVSWAFVKDINEVLKISDTIQAKIIRIDDRGRIDLSLKQMTDPPTPQQTQKFVKRTPYSNNEGRERFRQNFRQPEEKFQNQEKTQEKVQREHYVRPKEFRESRDFHEMRERYRESNPEISGSFEEKMASFLKTSEAKITDLNTRNSARSGRSTRRRNNNRD